MEQNRARAKSWRTTTLPLRGKKHGIHIGSIDGCTCFEHHNYMVNNNGTQDDVLNHSTSAFGPNFLLSHTLFLSEPTLALLCFQCSTYYEGHEKHNKNKAVQQH